MYKTFNVQGLFLFYFKLSHVDEFELFRTSEVQRLQTYKLVISRHLQHNFFLLTESPVPMNFLNVLTVFSTTRPTCITCLKFHMNSQPRWLLITLWPKLSFNCPWSFLLQHLGVNSWPTWTVSLRHFESFHKLWLLFHNLRSSPLPSVRFHYINVNNTILPISVNSLLAHHAPCINYPCTQKTSNTNPQIIR